MRWVEEIKPILFFFTGNRLQQITAGGDTTTYLYDDANRLEQLNGQAVYSFDANGNLLNSDTLTNTWDAANRLVSMTRDSSTIQPIYNGVNDRVGQTVSVTTTNFALDIIGLPEVIYTSEGNVYLHLPGVIVAESAMGETRYLLSDGLGSIRQAIDDSGQVVAYNEFDPYGNPIVNRQSEIENPYGFTGEWWEDEVSLLHLRARWYLPETGTFLSVDAVESEPPYQYVRGNPINYRDPAGLKPPPCTGDPTKICVTPPVGPETTEVRRPPPPPSPPPPPPKPHPTIGPATPPNPCKPYDEWIAVTPKRISGQVALNLNQSTGSNVDLALVEGSVEEECSYDFLSGAYSCQGNVGAAGGPGAIKVGYEGSITEDGYEHSVLVKGDIGVAEVEGSLGSGGIGVGGSINTPRQQIQLELQALPPSTPHFPFPHFIGINLTDAANNNGIHNWVRMTAGVEVDGLETEAPNIGELHAQLKRSYGVCFGLDVYYANNASFRHHPIYPQGYAARICNFR